MLTFRFLLSSASSFLFLSFSLSSSSQVVVAARANSGTPLGFALPWSQRKNHSSITSSKPTSPWSTSKIIPTANAPSTLRVPRGGTATNMKLFFDNAPMWESFSIIGAANGVGFLLNLLTKSHYHVDLIGTGCFALAIIPQLTSSNSRIQLSASFVAVWATKLASFLFYRVIKNKSDGRLDGTLSSPKGALGFWFVSALWGVLCGLPHYLGSTSSDNGDPTAIAVGTGMYLVGLVMETLADYQKWQFKKSNPGKFCNVGVWAVSQHPNWFGNLLIWTGIFVMNAPSLIDPVADGASLIEQIWSYKRVAGALVSPLFMWALFYGEATGAVTDAVASAEKRYGDDPNFKRYTRTVPLIIPNIF